MIKIYNLFYYWFISLIHNWVHNFIIFNRRNLLTCKSLISTWLIVSFWLNFITDCIHLFFLDFYFIFFQNLLLIHLIYGLHYFYLTFVLINFIILLSLLIFLRNRLLIIWNIDYLLFFWFWFCWKNNFRFFSEKFILLWVIPFDIMLRCFVDDFDHRFLFRISINSNEQSLVFLKFNKLLGSFFFRLTLNIFGDRTMETP